MNLRKLFNAPNPKQTLILLEEVELITTRCAVVGETEREEQREGKRSRNGKCPLCRGTNVVDRIANVQGIMGTDGRMRIETVAVNHCNTCTHEWEKFKMKAVTDTAVMRVTLNYLSEIITDPETQSKYSWKTEAIDVFKGCHAEAVLMMQNKHKYGVKQLLSIGDLRTKYKSIFDEENETNNNSSR